MSIHTPTGRRHMIKTGWLTGLVMVSALGLGPARAGMVSQGTKELGLSGNLDFDTADDALLELDITLGRFFRDSWEIGVLAGFATSDSLTRFQVGAFTEYNLEIGRLWVPFVGANVNLIAVDADFNDKTELGGGSVQSSALTGEDSAFGAGGVLGIKSFLHENVALTLALNMDWSTDDMFLKSGDTVGDTDLTVQLGIRYYF